MKKILLCSAIGLLTMAACTMELVQPQTEEAPVAEKTVPWTFGAGMPETKTTLDGTSVIWEVGDEITLYYLGSDNEPRSVTATAGKAGKSTVLTAFLPEGDEPDHFWAAYPAGSGALTYADGAEKFTIEVKAGDGSFKKANYMAAYSTAEAAQFNFKNAVGMFRLALPEGGVIKHGNDEYLIKTIRIKGKETSIHSLGAVEVSQEGGEVTGFGESTGTSSSSVALTDEVRASGVVYITSLPGELTNGFAVRYYADNGNIPAVLTGDKAIALERGHVQPIVDATPYIVWDYYVSPDGSGNGKGEDTPMSIATLQEMLTNSGKFMFAANQLTGTTIHFAAGTYNLATPLNFPSYTEMTQITLDGNGAAILDGQGACRIVEATGLRKNISFKGFTLQNGFHASKGAGIYVAPGKVAKDSEFVLDFTNCLIKGNTVTSGYGAGLAVEEAPLGQVRFNNCRFEANVATSGQGGAVYLVPNCGVAAMFNKCTFISNTSTANSYTIGVNCNGKEKDEYHGRLGMNNCTVNTGNANISNGAAITAKGYTVIANSTVWNSSGLGKWGNIALGANAAVQELDANGSTIVNCLIRNNSKNFKALYMHGSYYQNVKHCLYTGLTAAGGAEEGTHYTLTSSAEIAAAVDGAAPNNKAIDGVTAYYYSFNQDYSSDMTFPTLAQVREAIEGTTGIGPMFLAWLDTIEGSLTTDIAGNTRPEDASHPGSWQKQ